MLPKGYKQVKFKKKIERELVNMNKLNSPGPVRYLFFNRINARVHSFTAQNSYRTSKASKLTQKDTEFHFSAY